MVSLVLPRRIFRLWGVDHELADLGSTDTPVPDPGNTCRKLSVLNAARPVVTPHRRFAVLARLWIGSSIAKNPARTQQSVSNAFAFSAASLTMRPKLSED